MEILNVDKMSFGSKKYEFKCECIYKGGHSLHSGQSTILNWLQYGTLEIYTDKIIFKQKGSITRRKKWEIEIHVNKIDFNKVEQFIAGRMDTAGALGAAMGAGGLGVLVAIQKDLHIKIPHIDENGKKQEPIFALIIKKEAEKMQKWIYDRTSKEGVFDKEDNEAIKILKIRFAKGEITKKQFEEMTKDLES